MGGPGADKGTGNVSQFRAAVSTARADLGVGVEGGAVLTQAPFAFLGSRGGEDLVQASCQELQEATGLWFSPRRGNPR